MKLADALKLKVGQIVNFPADRGDKAGYGQVSHVSTAVNANMHGTEYVWVTVRDPFGDSKGVWPSNRLSA